MSKVTIFVFVVKKDTELLLNMSKVCRLRLCIYKVEIISYVLKWLANTDMIVMFINYTVWFL